MWAQRRRRARLAAARADHRPARTADPTTLPQIDGRWRLLYTSRPGTASPIQVRARSRRALPAAASAAVAAAPDSRRWSPRRLGLQRTFVGVEAFSVYQEVALRGGDAARVANVVEFGAAGYLRVRAAGAGIGSGPARV